MLYIVATPIGNLGDISFRAIETLKDADLIVAEDTRHTGKLLKRYEITTRMDSFHAHSNDAKLQKLLGLLEEGKNLALVSDAGTPGISDPGYNLIKSASKAGIEISPIPGATALIATLSVSGMPMHNFIFLGFLPMKKGRKTLFEEIKTFKYTTVFYESVHRIDKTLKQLVEYGMEERQICVGREVTKQFETFYRGTVAEVLAQGVQNKGEFTCVLGPEGY